MVKLDLRATYEQAVAAHRAGLLPEASMLYRKMLRAEPGNFSALHMLGLLEAQQGRFDEAATLLGRALKARPGEAATLGHYAHALMMASRFDEASAAYDQMLMANPQAVDAIYNKGVIASKQGRAAQALVLFDRALALAPGAANVLYSRGVVLAQLGRYQDALANYDRALAIQPNLTLALGNQAFAALNLCDWPRMAQIAHQTAVGLLPPLTFLGYSSDKALQLQCARSAIAQKVPHMPPPLWRGERYDHARIRLGYVSCDFNEHAVGMQIAPLIEGHDRSRFEVIAISIGGEDGSTMRQWLKGAFDQFHDFAALNSDEIARRMRALEIDIAIDLGGHTQGARLPIFSWRPAPVQVAWLGYPGTTGADFMDWLIADETVAPFEDQPYYSERLVHLPDTFFSTDPTRPIGMAPTRAQECLPDDAFVFCSFNNGWKNSPAMFDVWMRLLAAVPGSVLWLKQPNRDARKNLEKEAAARGIDPVRLVFARDALLDVHLARHALADLCLDTLPYNGHATTAHALWAGTPLLTCRGKAFAGRVAASLLKAVDMPELVTKNLANYEALALKLAREADTLAALKAKLAVNRTTTPLFDRDRFRRAIEAAYLQMLSAR